MINALVSHEMRNPLNSINAMILKIKMLLQKMDSHLDDHEMPENELREKLQRAQKELFESCEVLQSSSKLLNFCVDDMISLS